jgi:hypothetical protein
VIAANGQRLMWCRSRRRNRRVAPNATTAWCRSPDQSVRRPRSSFARKRPAMHAHQNRRDPEALRARLELRRALPWRPLHAEVMLLDELLTTGCIFKVCKEMLAEVWPETKIYGLFFARRVIDRTRHSKIFLNQTPKPIVKGMQISIQRDCTK